MHKVLVNPLGGLSLPRKSVVRLIDRPDMTLDVYRGRKTTIQHNMNSDIARMPVGPNLPFSYLFNGSMFSKGVNTVIKTVR